MKKRKLLIDTNNNLLKILLIIIAASIVVAVFVPTTILMYFFSWKIQLLLLLHLMLLNKINETLYALVIGSFYIAPLVSYVYFNLANGPILLGLSLSVMLITICVNYLIMSQDYPLETRTKNSTLSQLGKGSLISLCIVSVGVICFSILNIIPLTTVLYTASLSWFAIQMIYLRAVNILFEDNALGNGIDQASIAAMSLFADPVNILMQENNFTNNVVTRLIWLIWSVIFQVLEIPVSVFYYLRYRYRYKWYLDAVQQDGYNLESVPEEVQQSHPDICDTAVKQNGLSLEFVPEAVLRSCPEIALTAVTQNAYALEYVPETIRDKKMCEAAVQQEGMVLIYVPKEVLRSSPEIALAAVTKCGYALRHVPCHLRDKEMCEAAAVQNLPSLAGSSFLRHVPEEVLRSRPEIALTAVKQNGYALRHVPKALKTNVKILAKLFTTTEEQLRSDLELLGIDDEVIEQVISYIQAQIATESRLIEDLLGTGNDSKQPTENAGTDTIIAELLPIIGDYVSTHFNSENDEKESKSFTL